MKLLTKQLESKLPPLYSQDGKGDEAIAVVKFFHPLSDWTWYAIEYDLVDKIFFGLVQGFEEELGTFSLHDLENTTVKGVGIERDKYFDPTPIKKLRRK